ncbi:MAG: hypothetical protein IE916_00085 [Epsilonproteobacteria bacterium]|nr:hypothetical protein [Campylobacterota bacterium]
MHDNTLLFMRVGLNPTALQILSTLIEGKEPSIRACQLWYNGERTPKNGIVDIAHRLDTHMSEYALQIVHDLHVSDKKEILVCKFKNDDDLWTNHRSMYGLNNNVHTALINRIIVIGTAMGIDVHTQTSSVEDEDYNHEADWNSCANVWIDTGKII